MQILVPGSTVGTSGYPEFGFTSIACQGKLPPSGYSLCPQALNESLGMEEERERGKTESGRGSKANLPRIKHYADIDTFIGPKSWTRTQQLEMSRSKGQLAAVLHQITPVLVLLEGPECITGLSWPSLNAPLHIRIVTHAPDSSLTFPDMH